MNRFLDKTGLAYFWSKIKSRFDKADGSISDAFENGTACKTGNYYIDDSTLYKCIKDTDGTIGISNTDYFEKTNVASEIGTKLNRTIDVVGWNTDGHNFDIPNKNDMIIIFVGGGTSNAFSDIVTAVNAGNTIYYCHSNSANTIATNSAQIMVKNASGIYMIGVTIR